MSEFAFNLQRLLAALEMRQEDVARAVGVSKSAITFWRQGKSKPRPQAMRKLIELALTHAVNLDLVENLKRSAGEPLAPEEAVKPAQSEEAAFSELLKAVGRPEFRQRFPIWQRAISL